MKNAEGQKINLNGRKLIILSDSIEDYTDEERAEFLATLYDLEKDIQDHGVDVETVYVKDNIKRAMKDYDPANVVVFNWCEAINGNDRLYYKVPMILEELGFVYTGSTGEAFKNNQNKIITKKLLMKNGVKVPEYKEYKLGDDFSDWNIFPAIIKPINEHCSNGITRESVVMTADELQISANKILNTFSSGVLVEEFLDGSEYMVGLWGSDEYEVLPLVELDYSEVADEKDRIFSYEAKWDKSSDVFEDVTQHCPAVLDFALEQKIKDIAVLAFISTGCSNYGRLEIRLKNGVPYVLDVNANPDMMGPNEMILAASKLGYSHGEMFLKIAQLALEASDQAAPIQVVAKPYKSKEKTS